MKNLSITLLILSSLLFGTSAFAQSKNKSKNKRATVKTTRTIKNVRPNRKVVKVKTVKFKGKPKYAKKYGNKGYKKNNNKHFKKPKYKHNRKRHAKHAHSPRNLVGQRYSKLPRKAVRIVRHGRVQFYANNMFFRPVYKRGRTHFVVVF